MFAIYPVKISSRMLTKRTTRHYAILIWRLIPQIIWTDRSRTALARQLDGDIGYADSCKWQEWQLSMAQML